MQTPDYIAEAIEAQWGPRCPDFDAECACCLAWARYDALSAQDTGAIAGVRVKDLQWKEGPPSSYTEIADSPFGHYSVWEINGTGCWAPWKQGSGTIADGGLEGAKAAAQADYSARILSALEPQERDGWKTIETAPHSKPVLVFVPKADRPENLPIGWLFGLSWGRS